VKGRARPTGYSQSVCDVGEMSADAGDWQVLHGWRCPDAAIFLASRGNVLSANELEYLPSGFDSRRLHFGFSQVVYSQGVTSCGDAGCNPRLVSW